jgi:hypothetical protein
MWGRGKIRFRDHLGDHDSGRESRPTVEWEDSNTVTTTIFKGHVR